MENKNDDKLDELQQALDDNEYDIENYDRLIQYMQVYEEDEPWKWQTIDAIYEQKAQYFTLKLHELTSWILVKQKVDEGELLLFYGDAALNYYNIDMFKSYLNLLLENAMGETDHDFYLSEISEFMKIAVYDFENSNILWNLLIDHIKQHDSDNIAKLKGIYIKRLTYPHKELDESFNEYSSFISAHDPSNYEIELQNANKIYQSTKKLQPHYEKYESQIKENNQPHVWINYMSSVFKYSKTKNINEILPIFERAIANDETWTEEWETVWISIIYIIFSQDEIDTTNLQRILSKYLRTFPNSPCAYAENIRNSNLKQYKKICNRIDKIKFKDSVDYQKWKLVVLAMIQFENINKTEETIDKLITNLKAHANYALENNDLMHSVEKLIISLFTELGFQELAIELLKKMFDKFKEQVDVWLFGINYYKNDSDVNEIRELFNRALSNASMLDKPDKLTEEYLLFEQLNGDINSYRKATVKCNEAMIKAIKSKNENVIVEEVIKPKPQKKRKHEEEITRSREDYTIEVKNLPNTINEIEVKTFLEDCGTINNVSLIEKKDCKKAIIEFSNQQSVFAALIKNHKKIQGNEIEVTKLQENILFINNYPNDFNEDDLKSEFSKFGPIIDIRFPRQRQQQNKKRFCYLQFEFSNDAQKAILEYNGKEYIDKQSNRKYKWDVKISRPKERREREPPKEKDSKPKPHVKLTSMVPNNIKRRKQLNI
ncbi:unnamed protein product [Candida verbasci]|uniref:RRM domain-containing protein n=1 Tax=Candida verbasci TaxID=1227364 RepID=A0A9W4TSX4_9ASCO|nr:unnamed protein product [Candida verbasci]